MKILFFADKLPPEIGGMEVHAHYFIQHFYITDELIIISHNNGQDVLVNSKYKVIQPISIIDFISTFSEEKCVVFFNSGFWIEFFVQIKQLLKKAIFIYRTGGNEILKAPLTQNVPFHSERQKYWVDAINFSIDYLISNSNFTQERLVCLGIKKNIIKIISGGISLFEIEKALEEKTQTRQKIGIPQSQKVIVCCCRFVPYKRIDFLLNSFQYISKFHKIIMVGEGALLVQAKNIAKEKGLNIKFLGRLSNKQTLKIIAIGNVYCQASTDLLVSVQGGTYIHTEGMGRSLLEAMCLGVKIVVSECGAVSEIIDDENGTLVPLKENEKIFAEQIEKTLLLPPIAQQKRKAYCEQYSFERIFQQYRIFWQ